MFFMCGVPHRTFVTLRGASMVGILRYKRVRANSGKKSHHKVQYKVDRPEELCSALKQNLRRLKGKEI